MIHEVKDLENPGRDVGEIKLVRDDSGTSAYQVSTLSVCVEAAFRVDSGNRDSLMRAVEFVELGKFGASRRSSDSSLLRRRRKLELTANLEEDGARG